MTPCCNFPGCTAALSYKNKSGVCIKHSHAVGVCQCEKCMGAPKPKAPQSPDLKTAHVPVTISNTANRETKPVTLRRAPWE